MHLIFRFRENPRNPHLMAHHRRHNARFQTFCHRHDRAVKVLHTKIFKNIRIFHIRTDRIADIIRDVLDHFRILIHHHDLTAAALQRHCHAFSEAAGTKNYILFFHFHPSCTLFSCSGQSKYPHSALQLACSGAILLPLLSNHDPLLRQLSTFASSAHLSGKQKCKRHRT